MKAALAWSLALLSCADSLAPTLSPRVRPVPVDNVPPSPKPEIKSKYSAPPPPPPPLFLQRPTKSELNAPLAQEITFESSIDTLRPKSLAIFIGYHSRRNRGGLVALAKQASVDFSSIVTMSFIFVKRAFVKLSLGRKTLTAVNLLRLRATETAKRPKPAYVSKTEDQIARDNAYFAEVLLSQVRPATSDPMPVHDPVAGVSAVGPSAPTAAAQVSPEPTLEETAAEASSAERLPSDVAASFLPPALRRSEPASEINAASDVMPAPTWGISEMHAASVAIPASRIELPEVSATSNPIPESNLEMPEVHAASDDIPESQVELPDLHISSNALCETHLEALEMGTASDVVPESHMETPLVGSAKTTRVRKTSPGDQQEDSDLHDPLSSSRPRHTDVEVVSAAEAAAEAAIASGTIYERAFALSSPLKSATGNRTQKNKQLKTNPFYTLAAVAAASATASAAAAVATTAGAVAITATVVGAAVDAYTIARSHAANQQKENSLKEESTELLDGSSETETL